VVLLIAHFFNVCFPSILKLKSLVECVKHVLNYEHIVT